MYQAAKIFFKEAVLWRFAEIFIYASIKSKDDVLTLLVHLGYLAYDSTRKEVFIPNQEVADEFKNAVEYSGWEGISSALQASEDLLEATLRGDAEIVAKGIDAIHAAFVCIIRDCEAQGAEQLQIK